MPLEDVYLVSPRLEVVSEAEINALERNVGFSLPLGYREYLLRLGNGDFCHGLHVRTPSEVLAATNIEFWNDFLPVAIEEEFWDERPLLTNGELKNTVVFAESDEGDYFVSCPEREGQLFELPRHEARMHHCPEGFLEPFKFEFCRISGFNLPFFEPPNSRQAGIHLTLLAAESVQEVWDHVTQLSSSPLQVVEGKIGQTDRVIAFIPEISGCAWLEKQRFYFFSASEHAPVLEDIARRFQHLVK